MSEKKFTFIDLFAGCGGLSEGFLRSGHFEGIAHIEWELPMVETLRNRLNKNWNHTIEESKKAVVHFDLQKSYELINGKWTKETITLFGKTNHDDLLNNGLKGLVGKKKVDVIIGGPPCQAYSIAGRAQDSNSMKDDYRNYLFESFVDVVKFFKPRCFVFENVPGILSACPGNVKVTERISNAFKGIGYKILRPNELKSAVLTASDYGVPQKRNRLIIIGLKESDPLDLNQIYNSIKSEAGKIPTKTVEDTIKNLPVLKPLSSAQKVNGKRFSHYSIESEDNIKHHEPRYHNERDINIFYNWINKKMNKKSNFEKIEFYNNLMGKKSNHAKYRNLEWDKPSPTIVAHLYKDGLMFIHPDKEQSRSITVKEAALLQSFPDDFEFIGSQGVCFKMIGNAVPPKMAEVLANKIYEQLKN